MIRFFLLTLLFFLFINSDSQNLHFEGNITIAGTDTPLVKCKIQLFNKDSLKTHEVYTDRAGNYTFNLALSKSDNYLVRISHKGFVSKLYSISTENIPDHLRSTVFPKIQADLGLNRRVKGVDYSILNEPLNHYSYREDIDNYTYDKELLTRSIALLMDLKKQEEKQKQISNDTKNEIAKTNTSVSHSWSSRTVNQNSKPADVSPAITIADSSSRAQNKSAVTPENRQNVSQTIIFISIGLVVLLLGTIIKIWIWKKNDEIKRDL